MDRAKTTDEDFERWLDECASLISYAREHHHKARLRAKMTDDRDGYPARSMPESSVAGGRMSDPTADLVASLAGGKITSDHLGEILTDDTWEPPKNWAQGKVNSMNWKAEDARNRLREVCGAIREVLPEAVPDPIHEQCSSCFVSKDVVTEYGRKPKRWVVGNGRCKSCDDRLKKHTPLAVAR